MNWHSQISITKHFEIRRRADNCTGFDTNYIKYGTILDCVKRLSTQDENEPNIFYYHSDHIGSSSFITDNSGIACQHLQYLPFGELFVEQRSTANYYTPYKFSGKEKDEETSYSYFGARYYMSDVSVWLSVDPMWKERSWLSPYNYCQWNPVMLTDPTGMLDDGYTVDENGNVVWADNTGGDSYDVLYNKKDYDSGKRDYDRSGTKNGIQIDRGQFSNFKQKKFALTDSEGNRTGEIITRFNCEVKTKKVADDLHLFLSRVTNVEWANENFTSPDGQNTNVIVTSKEQKTVNQGFELTKQYLDSGYILNSSDHNHSWNDPDGKDVSGKYGQNGSIGSGDKGNKQQIQSIKGGKNAVFEMLYRGKHTPY